MRTAGNDSARAGSGVETDKRVCAALGPLANKTAKGAIAVTFGHRAHFASTQLIALSVPLMSSPERRGKLDHIVSGRRVLRGRQSARPGRRCCGGAWNR